MPRFFSAGMANSRCDGALSSNSTMNTARLPSFQFRMHVLPGSSEATIFCEAEFLRRFPGEADKADMWLGLIACLHAVNRGGFPSIEYSRDYREGFYY